MENQVIINRYINGATINGLAKLAHKSNRTIRKILTDDGVALRRQERKEKKFFNGKSYTQNSKGYWRTTTKPRSFLQRDVFESFHGRKIKEDHDINHIDHDKDNNDPSNLEEIQHVEHGHETGFWNKNRGSELDV